MSILPNQQFHYTYPPIIDNFVMIRRILDSDLEDNVKIKVLRLIAGNPTATVPTTTPRPMYPQGPTWTTTVNATGNITEEDLLAAVTKQVKMSDAYVTARQERQAKQFDFDATGQLVDGVQSRGDNPNNDNHGQGTYRNGVYTA